MKPTNPPDQLLVLASIYFCIYREVITGFITATTWYSLYTFLIICKEKCLEIIIVIVIIQSKAFVFLFLWNAVGRLTQWA
jgi:hypothetical protein